jgi:hypothetical protein
VPFLKSGKDLRENPFSFAENRYIREPSSEKKGVRIGHFRAPDNHLYPRESLPDPSQEVKGAFDVPQVESAADEVRLPIENLFKKMLVIEFLFFTGQPPA